MPRITERELVPHLQPTYRFVVGVADVYLTCHSKLLEPAPSPSRERHYLVVIPIIKPEIGNEALGSSGDSGLS
jgi:hypothetical protein